GKCGACGDRPARRARERRGGPHQHRDVARLRAVLDVLRLPPVRPGDGAVSLHDGPAPAGPDARPGRARAAGATPRGSPLPRRADRCMKWFPERTVNGDDPMSRGGLMGTVMEVQGLRVSYGRREVLHGIDLPIEKGAVTALVGPSGCGKTTLLRTLNRLTDLNPDVRVRGKVRLDGEDCMQMDPIALRRRVGMVFQKPNPFPIAIRENVLYGAKARGVRGSRHDDIVEASLRKAVLWDDVKDRLDESGLALSGGQQQRVCIARTLATSPEVVLMDEPGASLDPKSTMLLEQSIVAMKGDYTVVVVTHELGQAHRVSDHLAFLYDGRVIEYGPTRQLFEQPQQPATRDYLAGGLVALPSVDEQTRAVVA